MKMLDKIYNIIGETIRVNINEMVSPIVWHFCWFDNLLGILKTNSFQLSKSEVDRDKLPGVTGYSSKRPYYFCTTRSKLSSDGYSDLVTNDNQEGFVRIQFDGSKLNSIVHSKASDYFGERGEPVHGKRAFYDYIGKGETKYSKILNKENEKEDTVWYHKGIIPNISNYIQRIDVCIPNEQSFFENKTILQTIYNLAKQLNIPIYYYNNIQDFDKQNQKTINIMNESRKIIKENDNISEKIKPTSEWMRKWYDAMNQQLFNGTLGDCILQPFTTGKGSNGRTLGWFKITGNNIKVNRATRKMFYQDFYGDATFITRENFVSLCKPTIELNANYKAPEESWLNTLVHEMCHYYTYMYGIAPKQGHGPEFRQIGEMVSANSNGTITIQRLASAEEMKNYDLDANIQAKNQARLERKKSNLNALVVVINNGQVRLIMTTLEKVMNDVRNVHLSLNNAKYYGYCNDMDLISKLYEKGYRKSMRTYRFWDITEKKDIMNDFLKYDWYKVLGDCQTLSEALGIEQQSSNSEPILRAANQTANDEYKLGYKIVQDNGGYNLMDKSGHKTFGNPVAKIWFNNEENLYQFQNGKFTFIGTPGHWSKYNMQENIVRKMNEDNDYLKKLIRETIEEIVTEKLGLNNDIVEINPEMNLGLESPLEIM